MFIPMTKQEMQERNIKQFDFIYISGDAYIDHPSFGPAIICRILEAFGYSVGMIATPNLNNNDDFTKFGQPRLAFLISSGSIDSMVNNYTSSLRKRTEDSFSEGGIRKYRYDYAVVKYTQKVRSLYKKTPIIIGGIEASLRRLSHYDYLSNTIKPSIILESGADLISYGMGDKVIVDIADALSSGINIKDLTYLEGTVFKTKDENLIPSDAIVLPTYEELLKDKLEYARSFMVQYKNSDAFSAKPLVEKNGNIYVIQNTPPKPLPQEYLDWVYALPFERKAHPSYKQKIPALDEVKYSININRGCFGNCSFCAIAMHQGRIIQARSKESVIDEAKIFLEDPEFKGYIHDVGGPTANFYQKACEKQDRFGACANKQCLDPEKCKNLIVSHDDYLDILRELRNLKGVKKVFIRSGIRYDYLMYDKKDDFFRELVKYHISGQLRVAPEHISSRVLKYMQKPKKELYFAFCDKFDKLNKEYNLKQYIVPYLMSSHPGSTLEDAIMLAEYIRDNKTYIEQVQDFYPTPSTLATCMYYTEVDPRTMEPIYVAKTKEERAMQRALLQFQNPKNYDLVYKALVKAKRLDLIGNGPKCLIRDKMRVKKS